jgi:hypothetical protein
MALPCFLSDNRFLDGTPTATDTAVGYSVLNITDLRLYTFWQAASFGTKYITIDCATSKAADTISIVGHNFYTSTATISLESSTTGAWAGEQVVRVAGFIPSNDKALMVQFASVSARYWRLKIITSAIAPYCAVVLLGARLEMPYPPDSPYIPFEESIIAITERSKAGYILGATVRYYPITITPNFSNLSTSFVYNTFQPWWDSYAKTLKPFIYSWDCVNFPAHIFLVSVDDQNSVYNPSLVYAGLVENLSLYLMGIKEL